MVASPVTFCSRKWEILLLETCFHLSSPHAPDYDLVSRKKQVDDAVTWTSRDSRAKHILLH